MVLSVLSRLATSISPGKLLEMQVLRPTPDLLNEKLGGGDQLSRVFFTSMLDDFDVVWLNLETLLEDSGEPSLLRCLIAEFYSGNCPDLPKIWPLPRDSLHPIAVHEEAWPLP